MPEIDLIHQYPDLQDKLVLNVDDNEMNRMVIAKILERVGLRTVQARNGAEALEKLSEGLKPDAILMDLEMPVLNGLQASEIIKKDYDSHIPIIINSGNVEASKKWRLKKLGIYDFLEKPYTLKDIFGKLNKYLVVQIPL